MQNNFEEKPKEKTFEEWTRELEKINARNMMETNCIQVTLIQWNELKWIVSKIQNNLDNVTLTLQVNDLMT